MSEETYKLQVNCKNRACRKEFTIMSLVKGKGYAEYASQKEAVKTLADLILAETDQEARNLRNIIHSKPPADLKQVRRFETCPHCDRMYVYRAEEVFVQMPPEAPKWTSNVDNWETGGKVFGEDS